MLCCACSVGVCCHLLLLGFPGLIVWLIVSICLFVNVVWLMGLVVGLNLWVLELLFLSLGLLIGLVFGLV